VEFWSILYNVKPSQANAKPPYWELSGDGSVHNTDPDGGQAMGEV